MAFQKILLLKRLLLNSLTNSLILIILVWIESFSVLSINISNTKNSLSIIETDFNGTYLKVPEKP